MGSLGLFLRYAARNPHQNRSPPMIENLYHISANKFDQFKQQQKQGWSATDAGFHFGTKETALSRASQITQDSEYGWKKGKPLYLYTVNLNVSKPLHLPENRLGAWSVSDILQEIFGAIERGASIPGITDEMFDQWYEDVWMVKGENAKDSLGNSVFEDVKALTTWLKKIGYDSISYDNEYEGGGISYIVFDPNQIKITNVEEIEVGDAVESNFSEHASDPVWIHYSKLPQVTINPKGMHQDPAGIYLFPADFKPVEMWQTLPYRFEVQLDPSARVMDLTQLNVSEAKDILQNLGIDYWEIKGEDHRDQIRSFWDGMKNEFILKSGRREGAWNKALRDLGYDAIFDDEKIIHGAEEQLLVLDPRKIKVLKRDDQSATGYGEVLEVMRHVEEFLKPYGKVEVDPPKLRKIGWGQKKEIAGYTKVGDEKVYANWSIMPQYHPGNKSRPSSVGVHLDFSSPRLEYGAGGEVSILTKPLDFKKLDEELKRTMDKIWKEAGKGQVESVLAATSTTDLETQSRRLLDQFFGEFQLPTPNFKIVDQLSQRWLGRTAYSSTKDPDNCLIEIQKRVLNDQKTLERVLVHELIHHADFLLNYRPHAGKPMDPFTRKLLKRDSHGKFFREESARINQALGKDFVTEKSDQDYVIESDREFYLLVQPHGSGYGYNYFLRPSAEDKKGIQLVIEHRQGKLFKVNDVAFLSKNRPKFSPGAFFVPRSTQQALRDKLKELYEGGKQVALSGGWYAWESESPYPFGSPMDQVEIENPPEVLVDQPLGIQPLGIPPVRKALDEEPFLVEASSRRDLSTVYHIGSMAGRGKPDFSLEGNGLSISQDPGAWIKIARLGGQSLFKLTKKNPRFYFADRDDLKSIEWGIKNDFLKSANKWRAWKTDEEGNEEYSEFDSEKEAKNEVDDPGEIELTKGYDFGPKGIKYWKESFSSKPRNSLATDLAPVFYAESQGYDGVWWEEILDPQRFSAPRGVIFQKKIPTWKVTQIEEIPNESVEGSAAESFLPEDLLMLDCEMTGVVPDRDQLLQIAMVKLKLQGNQYVEQGEPLVLYLKHEGHPQNDFHKQYLTHIFEKCNESDLTPEQAKEKIHDWLGDLKGKVTPAGDAVHTDINFLNHHGCINGSDIGDDGPIPGTFHYELFDANPIKAIARQKAGKKEDKKELAGFDEEGIHDALVDCHNQTKELNHYLEILIPSNEWVPHTTGSFLVEALTKEEIKEMFAGTTSFLHYPIHIDGETDEHHITVKFFDKTPVTTEQIEEVTKGIPKTPPPISSWNPIILQGKRGDVKVLELDKLPPHVSQLHYALEAIRKDDYPDYRPHITVSEELWDRIKAEKLGPQDLGVKAGPLTFESMGKIEKVFAGFDAGNYWKKDTNFLAVASKPYPGIMGGVWDQTKETLLQQDSVFSKGTELSYLGKESAQSGLTRRSANLKTFLLNPDQKLAGLSHLLKNKVPPKTYAAFEQKLKNQDNDLFKVVSSPTHSTVGKVDAMVVRCRVDNSSHRLLFIGYHFDGMVPVLLEFWRTLDKNVEKKYPETPPWALPTQSSLSKFESAIQSHNGYTEIFRNPSSKELLIAQGKHGDLLRAFLDGDDLLVWESSKALHSEVMRDIKFKTSDPIPLLIYSFDSSGGVEVEVTDTARRTKWHHNPKVKDAIESHPWIKKLGHDGFVDIHYYDEAIVGPWDELEPEQVSAAVQISFLKQPKLWDGKAPIGDRFLLKDRVYIVDKDPVEWVVEHLDIPEGTLYYEFYEKPEPATEEGVTAPVAPKVEAPEGEAPKLKSPLPTELPDLFFEIYRGSILYHEGQFRTYSVDEALQNFILRIMTSQRTKVPSFKIRATQPAVKKTIMTQAFLKNGLRALSIVDWRLATGPFGDIPYYGIEPMNNPLYKMTDVDPAKEPLYRRLFGRQVYVSPIVNAKTEKKKSKSVLDWRISTEDGIPYHGGNPVNDPLLYQMTDTEEGVPWLVGDDPLFNRPVVNAGKSTHGYEDEGFVGKHWGSEASGILFRCGDKVLLMKRSSQVVDPGKWGIPGGAIPIDPKAGPMDPKESAIKESSEEMGGMPAYRDTGKRTVWKDDSFRYTTFVFAVDQEFKPVTNWEHDESGWFGMDELPDLHPGVAWALQKLEMV